MKARQQSDDEFESMLADDQKEYEKEQKAKDKSKNKGGSQTGEFLSLVDWTEGEQDKVYAGKSNEQQLTLKYNANIKRGKELAKQLRKNRVKLKGYSVNYFNQYTLWWALKSILGGSEGKRSLFSCFFSNFLITSIINEHDGRNQL